MDVGVEVVVLVVVGLVQEWEVEGAFGGGSLRDKLVGESCSAADDDLPAVWEDLVGCVPPAVGEVYVLVFNPIAKSVRGAGS